MKNIGYEKFKKIRKNLLIGASSGLVAGVLFVSNASRVNAQVVDSYNPRTHQSSSVSGMHVMRRWNSKAKIGALASNLGLDPNIIQEEIKSGKTLKQVLQENGIDTNSLGKAFNKKSNKSWRKNTF